MKNLLQPALWVHRVVSTIGEILDNEGSHDFVEVQDRILIESFAVVSICVPNRWKRIWNEMKNWNTTFIERHVVILDIRKSKVIEEDVGRAVLNGLQMRCWLQRVFNLLHSIVENASLPESAHESRVGVTDEIQKNQNILKLFKLWQTSIKDARVGTHNSINFPFILVTCQLPFTCKVTWPIKRISHWPVLESFFTIEENQHQAQVGSWKDLLQKWHSRLHKVQHDGTRHRGVWKSSNFTFNNFHFLIVQPVAPKNFPSGKYFES